MTALVTSDTHITDRPHDEYRWSLFAWLREQAREHKADEIIHCGDLTDQKDRHPARLVNRLVEEVIQLGQVADFVLLKGNHDFIDPNHPFFEFIRTDAAITYVKTPEIVDLSIGKATFIPAGTPWNFKLHEFPYGFTHTPFDGAVAENGRLLPGADPALLQHYQGRVYSGDIHVPQRLRRNIEYIGAPYHVRFGDAFEPRVLLIRDDGSTKNLHYPAPRKVTLDGDSVQEIMQSGSAQRGDHVRVRFRLKRGDYAGWRDTRTKLRETVEAQGWVLFSVEPIMEEAQRREQTNATPYMSRDQLLVAYAKRHKLSEAYLAVGKDLLL